MGLVSHPFNLHFEDGAMRLLILLATVSAVLAANPVSQAQERATRNTTQEESQDQDQTVQTLEIVVDSTIWEECWEREFCIRVAGRRYCKTLKACVEVFERNGEFLLRTRILEGSNTLASYTTALANACFEALRYGPFSVKVCVSDLNIQDRRLRSLRLKVRGCVGFRIGSVGYERCADLYHDTLRFLFVEMITPSDDDPDGPYSDPAPGYIVWEDGDDNVEVTTTQQETK